MSNWVSITINTLYEAKMSVIVDLCDSLLLKGGQPNRAAGIIQDRVNHVRRKVASHQRNQLDQDVTKIPQGLLDITVILILEKLKNTLEIELTEDERRVWTRANIDLDRVASGTDVVDAPDNPIIAPMEPLVPPPSFGCRRTNQRDAGLNY